MRRQLAAAKAKAESIRKQVTPGNFAEMAKKYSEDNGTKATGGDLGVFEKGRMVPEFQNAVLTLKPGEISGPVQSDYGYHIISVRETWADAKDKFSAQYAQQDRGDQSRERLQREPREGSEDRGEAGGDEDDSRHRGRSRRVSR